MSKSSMSDRIVLDESTDAFSSIKEKWRVRAKAATLETLPQFISDLTTQYQHDYGTICHAVTFAALAAASAVNRSPNGGITGFQAGCIMWEFIMEWNHSENKTGMRLVDYDNFLYPQYEGSFQKTLTLNTWDALQKEAASHIKQADLEYRDYLAASQRYQVDITAFVEKYPDYYERRTYYDPIMGGTGPEWEAEEQKKKNGFVFAPQKPYEPIYKTSRVYQHWESIVNGQVPFGYIVDEKGAV